jgi:metal-responsive CopG/Arc/MetJ family transcriptional regulator
MTYQTFNISLPKDLVTAMDSAAKREYRNRSDLIREAVRAYLADMIAWNSLFVYGNKRAKIKDIRSEKDVEKLVAEYRKGK